MPSSDDLSLAKRVVEQGVCQQAEVEECLAIQRKSEQNGQLELLGDLLVQRGFMTKSQLDRLLQTGSVVPPQAIPSTLRLGPYELLLKLGEGGMGAVYKANDTRNGKIVAIKVLPRSKAKDELFLKRFEMEARATFDLDHPNIVHGYDVGNSDGYHYLVIEFVQGYDLCALLEQRGRFTETEALNILEQMSKALDHIHTEHLVHRDIKPENILVGENGVAKLTDMGLTVDDPTHGRRRRLTQAGIAMGTPFYLSPEQIKGESDVDIRSDIYALGATTYEMVTGRPPFEGDTPAIVMMKHLNEYVPSPHDLDRTITINFCHLLERMMAKDPFHRYQTPYELLQDVRRVIRGKQPVGIRPPAGRSSVARPELHQHSQRLTAIESRTNPIPDTKESPSPVSARENSKDATKYYPSGVANPEILKPGASRSPSSNLLPAVDVQTAGVARPTSSKAAAAQSGSKQIAVVDTSESHSTDDARPKNPDKPRNPGAQPANLRATQLRKATQTSRNVQMPAWMLVVALIIGAMGGAFLIYQLMSDEKKNGTNPTDSRPPKTQPALSSSPKP